MRHVNPSSTFPELKLKAKKIQRPDETKALKKQSMILKKESFRNNEPPYQTHFKRRLFWTNSQL